MTKLWISDDLGLPIDVTTQALAFLGRRGSGKSYAFLRLCELMLDHGAQVVILDPVGVSWGLRLAANGKDKGYAIPVFGGLHGDLPLDSRSGKLMADVIVDRNLSAVLDVSQFETDSDFNRFAIDFGEELFFRRKAQPSPMHLGIDECQEVIPQNPMKGEEKKLHVFQRLVKLGRNFGIGVSLISQRPQEVHKKVLNQAECLFVFQMTGPHERKALQDWISEKGVDEDLSDILPHLKVGCPHVWSPQWLQVSKEIRISKKITFDASSTPKVGAKVSPAQPLSPIDLEALRVSMAEVVERTEQEDPALLRQKIAKLEKEIRTRPVQIQPKVEQVRVEVPVLAATQITDLKSVAQTFSRASEEVVTVVREFTLKLASLNGHRPQAQVSMPIRTQIPIAPVRSKPIVESSGVFVLGERRILSALLRYPNGKSKTELAVVTGYKHKGGAYNNYLGSLKSQGLIEGNKDLFRLTPEGQGVAAQFYNVLPEDLIGYWKGHLPKAERTIFGFLVEQYPQAYTKEEIATSTGYDAGGGGFSNALSRVKVLEIVTKIGQHYSASEKVMQA